MNKIKLLSATALIVLAGAAVAACTAQAKGTGHTVAHTTSLPHFNSANDVAKALTQTNKFTVGGIAKDSDQGLLSGMGGVAYSLPITQGADTEIVGVNVFGKHSDLVAWAKLSQSLGGIAVVGDNWAISLQSHAPTGETKSDAYYVRMSVAWAPVIAHALKADVSLTE